MLKLSVEQIIQKINDQGEYSMLSQKTIPSPIKIDTYVPYVSVVLFMMVINSERKYGVIAFILNTSDGLRKIQQQRK